MDLYNLVVSAKISKGGGGGDIDVDALTVTENGVYTASSGHAYSPVTVSVPQSGITPTGTSVITANGLYDVTDFASASVSVPTGIIPSGTSSITSNGIYDITSFASVDVNVSGGGGGYTDDDVAMRDISGVVSGSATFIGQNAFYSCSKITVASFPNATKINANAFNGCESLTTANFSNATSVDTNAFANCKSLTTVVIPNATFIGQNAFYNCKALATASFPNVSTISSSAFSTCTSMMSIYLLASSRAYMANANAFTNTPMSNSTYTGSFGSIYVPASLVDTYKSATNWSKYADRITSYVE